MSNVYCFDLPQKNANDITTLIRIIERYGKYL